ncbi:MAG: KilA-N domain-containing protein [Bacteroidia bacterium]|nr:KilA-N domain-containing protein [Bacteroidia bacterium]
MSKIKVKNTEITIIQDGDNDLISLTDMLKAKEGNFLIENWLRNRNTIEFLGIWEAINNPNFNYPEFEGIKKVAGLNSFTISVKEWVSKTKAIGLTAKAGRYGGTYAHKDIAFEFGTWISPEFKLYLIKEFQRLKDEESKSLNKEWDYRRFLSKVNYRIHTEAVKENLIPKYSSTIESYIYASEAEMLNVAVFGITSKEWRENNKEADKKGLNIRDMANIHQLTVLSNLESYSSILINEGLSPENRLIKLKESAVNQLRAISKQNYTYSIESPNHLKFS